jgi:hypothetical protein
MKVTVHPALCKLLGDVGLFVSAIGGKATPLTLMFGIEVVIKNESILI